MRYAHLLLTAVLLLAGCAGSTQPTTTTSTSVEGLDALIPATLPAGCTARSLDDDAPPFLTANPMTSTDPAFVQGVSNGAFRGDAPADRITEALMAVYDSGHENGMFAFRFDDRAIAEQAGAFLQENEDAQFVRVQGNTLVAVWRDGPEDACFSALTAHAASIIGQ